MSVVRIGCLAVIASVLVAITANAEPELGIVFENSLDFAPCEDVKIMHIYNSGDGVLEWSIWLSEDYVTADPVSGTNEPGWENRTTVTVSLDRSTLPYGRYLVNMFISGNFPRQLVFVDVFQNEGPGLTVRPTSMFLSLDAPDDELSIGNLGSEPVDWSISSDVSWLSVTPATTGSAPCPNSYTDLTVSLIPSGLPSLGDAHIGHLTVDSNGGSQTVRVEYFPAEAPSGALGVFMDYVGTDCNIVYQGAGLVSVYVVHIDFLGATAAQFAAPKPDCWTDAAFLSDTDVFPITIGSSQTGKAVGYGTCMSPPMLVTTINYFVQGGANPACCPYPVIPDPNIASGEIEIVDCANVIRHAAGLVSMVNPDGSCPCGTVPIQNTTWGRVKAMYAPEDVPGSR